MHHVRPHSVADSDAIATILADGWGFAYAGFVPAGVLAKRSDRAARRLEIAEFLAEEFNPEVEGLLVAEDGSVDGFVHMVLEDKADLGAAAHINLLYVSPDRLRLGLGRLLMGAAGDWLGARVTGPIVLSAFEKNPHRRFYAAIGGVEAKRVMHDYEGTQLESVLYRWDSPAALVAGARGA